MLGSTKTVWQRPEAPNSPGYLAGYCPRNRLRNKFRLVVAGGSFSAGQFNGTVDQDGHLYAVGTFILRNVLEGVVDGEKASGTLSNSVCAWSFDAARESPDSE